MSSVRLAKKNINSANIERRHRAKNISIPFNDVVTAANIYMFKNRLYETNLAYALRGK